MDTLDLYNLNTTNNTKAAVNFAITSVVILVLPFVYYPPMFANDSLLSHATVPEIKIDTGQFVKQFSEFSTLENRIKEFDEGIAHKYAGGIIKDVDTGVKHIRLTKYYDGKPVRLNIVEIDRGLASDYELKPALASTEDNLHKKNTITTIAKQSNAIVAINGTFFKPQTGVPLGTLMIDGKIITGPIYDRVAIGIGENDFRIARTQINAKLTSNGKSLKIDNINQPRMLANYSLVYTREWGEKAPASPKYGYQIAIEDHRIVQTSSNPLVIPERGYVVVAPYRALEPFLKENRVNIEIKTTPEWKNIKHVISGGPYLVKDSEIFVDMSSEKLSAIGGKNPRSAIGYTKDNRLIMVAADGRENHSVGMTLMQLAGLMKSLGCTNAINLDGGGSTVMYVNGQVVNNPAFKGGIAISNALVLSRK